MQITEEDDVVMIVKYRNTIAYLIGTFFALFGILIMTDQAFFINKPPVWAGAVSLLMGAFVLAVAETTTVILDNAAKKIIVERKKLIGRRTRECDFAEVKDVELQTAYYQSSRGGGYSFQLVFVLHNGETIPFGSQGSIRMMGKQVNTLSGIGIRVANFLNVPFEERRPPSPSEIMSAVQSGIQAGIEKEMTKGERR